MSSQEKDSTELSKSGVFSVKIFSSWHCATENGLEKVLIVQEDLGEDVDPTSLMSVETCVFLTKEGKSADESVREGCSITLQTSGNTVISNLSILSEARLLEVYGPCEEYLKTVRGEFLLEVEDTTVYCADIKLDYPCDNLILKFNGLSRENDLWLYGLLVQWRTASSRPNSIHPNGTQCSPFNFEAVDRRLSDLGHDVSGNPQQYKKILELCNTKSKHSRGDIQALKPSISSFVASMFPGSQLQTSHVRESAATQNFHLELLLDQKLKQLEHNILDHIDKRIEEMEKKQEVFINASLERFMKQIQLGFNSIKDQPSTSTLD